MTRPQRTAPTPFSAREFNLTYEGKPSGASRLFLSTPPRCPRRGVWISRLSYTVTTGATYSVRSTQRCRRPKIRASLKPRRVRAGEQARIRVRLRSSEARCIAAAKVRLAGRRARTNRAGRATIATTFRRPGAWRLTATKRGCARGLATLAVGAKR